VLGRYVSARDDPFTHVRILVRPSAVQARVGRQSQIVLDMVAWGVGLVLIDLVRYDNSIPRVGYHGLVRLVGLAAALQLVVGLGLSLYRRRYRYGSFEEVAGLAATVALVTPVLIFADLESAPRWVPLSVAVTGGIPALMMMTSTRYAWRFLLQHRRRPRAEDVRRLLVFGAGEAGQQLVDALLRDSQSAYVPVALLDDDLTKRNLRVRGLRVAGDRTKLLQAKHAYDADTLLIAVPTADAALVRDLSGLAEAADLDVKILPPVADLIDGRVGLADIRDIEVADLLGRRQVDTDVSAIAHYLTGKRVLITGAGGSIGSELCRQIHQYGPAELMMLDRDESALHAVQLSINGRALLDDDTTVLADIRDTEHVNRLFEERRPQVVFHAAALKHFPLLQRYPGEAVKSNVWGTLTVLEAARDAGVERFVNISTDKAAQPQNVLGYSKRIAERLTAHVAATADGTYLSVRFGNVLGSRGSVLTAFQAQIAAGGPVTVTHPDVTRFFMTVQEAVQLVIQAGAIGSDGEVLVLDMGEPVRIADVARRLVAEAPRPVQIVFTGLRPGEKMHEDLLAPGEADHRPVHPLISHVKVPPVKPLDVRELDPWAAAAHVIADLQELCGVLTSQQELGQLRS
jgi:FlaA1/EpsC-like NDP-sugar epimerase